MDFFNSIEFYALALVVAVALLGLIFNPKAQAAVITHIEPMFLLPAQGVEQRNQLVLSTGPDGVLTITHDNVTASPADMLHVVVSVAGDHVKLEEN